jgi:hypothetical protein
LQGFLYGFRRGWVGRFRVSVVTCGVRRAFLQGFLCGFLRGFLRFLLLLLKFHCFRRGNITCFFPIH